MGWTNGSEIFSTYGALNGQNNGCLQFDTSSNLELPLGTVVTEYHYNNSNKVTGVVTDPAKSGIVAVLRENTIGTVSSKKLGKFYIRY